MNARSPAIALTQAEQQRIAEVHRLVRSTPAGVAALLEMLVDSSWSVRREVVWGLAELGALAAGPLCDLLRTRRDNEARIAAAVDALVASSADVLDDVSRLARDKDPAVVADAAQILGRRLSSKAVPVLAGLVAHQDDNVAIAAIEALGRIGGPAAIETLITAAQSGNFFRVFPAIDVLGRSGDPRAIPPLAALLSSSVYTLEAARALGKTGESAAVGPLAALLSHPSETTIRIAALALADLHARHLERYASEAAPEAALRRTTAEAAVFRLTRCLVGATQDEQVAIAFVLGVIGGDGAAAGLRSLLDAPGPASQAAAVALKRLGKHSDLHMREALREGDSARRQILLPIVSRAAVSAEVVECLRDADATVRALACDALARVGAVASVGALFPLLADANQRVVQAATGAIQSLGSAETQALALTYARDTNPAVKRGAIRILGYFGCSEALSIFIGALDDDDIRTRDAALLGLAFLDAPEAIAALLSSTQNAQEKTRSAAMRALGQCTKKDARIPAYLLIGLKDPDAWVRYYACQALGRLGIESTSETIAGLLDDEAGQVRVAAVEALSHFKSDVALSALQRVAEGDEPDMRRAALIGLGLARRPEAARVLLKAAQSADAATRLVAISALADSASARTLPVLASAARDPDDNVRAAAMSFLAGHPSPEGTAILIELLREPSARERVVPLLSVPSEGRVAGLMTALGSADAELALVLASALARMRSREADEALLHAISLPWVPARKAAAASLASLRSPAAFAALRQAAERDADPHVRQICTVLLSQ
jgi:HEAT repeat protein